MMWWLIALATLMAPCAAAGEIKYTAAQLAIEITNLPGLTEPIPFRQFAGYVNVTSGAGRIFFWFVTSPNAASDPVALWTNGGPGCSGLTGFLTEHGPFRPNAGGNLERNPYAWNAVANRGYVEQPVGVGFSPVTRPVQYGDVTAASDNLAFVVGFFKLFPQFSGNDFFITSESYGGHYMPTLAEALVAPPRAVTNFKGFLVGNPLTYLTYRNYGELATYYGHQLLPKPLWDEYEAANCREAPGLDPGPRCTNITDRMEELVAGLDPYALDFPKCSGSPLAAGRYERWSLRSILTRARRRARPKSYPYFPTDYQPCTADWATAYLSRKDVQAAIHAEPGGLTWSGNWSACSDAVNTNYSDVDTAAPMMPIYSKLIGKGYGLRITVFSGDDDAVCATRGTQQWIWDLGLAVTKPWSPWLMNDGPGCEGGPACRQVAGYQAQFEGLSFVTVHGAGHLVPATRPAAGLAVFRNFLMGKSM